MAYNEKKKVSNAKWDAVNIDRMSLALPKGLKDRIKAAIEGTDTSMNAFITQAIREKLDSKKKQEELLQAAIKSIENQ